MPALELAGLAQGARRCGPEEGILAYLIRGRVVAEADRQEPAHA